MKKLHKERGIDMPFFKFDLKMKFTILFVFASIFSALANNGYTQSVTLSIENKTVAKVIDRIEATTEYRFVFNTKFVDLNRRISIKVENAKIETVLNTLFYNTNTDYKINDTQVVLKNKENPIRNLGLVIQKPIINTEIQKYNVTGIVADINGQPLPGANILEKGTSNGTQTDFDGKFSLDVTNENAVLIISYIGYFTKEISVTGQSNIEIVLSENASSLDEIVVVGYGTQKKVNLTGAVSSVKMDEVLGDRPVSDAGKALQGSVPGLQITYGSGQPGKDVDINIRGFSSINGGEPLVLVDNVPMDLNDINPRDIENVSVLKDASSASIYGARAAFGVVLITTKRGRKNQVPTFNYSSTIGWNKASTILEKASPREFVTALQDWGYPNFGDQDVDTWLGYIDQYEANPSAYPDGIITEDSGLKYVVRGSDVINDFLNQAGFQQLHNLSINGGSESTTYRVSFGVSDEDGIMVGNNDTYRRYNLNTFISTDLTSKLNFTVNSLYKNALRKDPVSGNWRQLYKDAINFYSAIPSGYGMIESGELVPYRTPANTVLLSPVAKAYDQVVRIFGKLTYDFTDDFSVNAEYTYQNSVNNREIPSYIPSFIHPKSFDYEPYNPNKSGYSASNGRETYNAVNIYGSFGKELGDHSFKLLLGYNQEYNQLKRFSADRQVLLSPDLPGLSTGIGLINASDFYSDYGVVGFFGRFNYSYKDKYLFEANSRYDGSSRFAKGKRFGFFPSASAAWRVSEEDFMSALKPIVSNFKLRVSYGEIGNQDVDNYAYLPTMNPFETNWINTQTGALGVSIKSPNLVSDSFTWETVRTLDFGVDLGFFDNKLQTTFDWYNRETLDMLAPGAELPAVLGGSAPLNNVADLSTKGWELSVNFRDNIGKDFKYSLGFNVFDSKTKITKFNNESGLINQYYVGQTIGEIWGYTTDRFFTVDDFEPGTLNDDLMGGTLLDGIAPLRNVDQNPGDVKYVDLNGDGVIWRGNNTLENPGDKRIIGNDTRRYQYGITATADYKNFDFSIFLQGVGKRDIWMGGVEYFPLNHRFTTIYKHQLDYWTPENTDAFYPRNYLNGQGNYKNNREVQTKYLQNGAYLRLKNITLGYTLPEKLMKSLKVSNFRVFVTGENLLNFDHVADGIDPDLDLVTGSEGNYPYLKNISAGVNITF
ncbi:TonB-linked outer membrane protein, SusC/RagA family [Flaviramulus basaltis]|uniref:TonB-linked outer membrane protein, SusC/RagA family n=1 Tax=Flaviramulus basaltis TaxID=369401 RepID=A0A1K2IAX9_9FLAO|nr:TonB-dependent receptor [Flaviramulus basaltis]SFZ89464.1 TonB-linked outer membrane protein, SusC/RagA family [Flaviramulus basaltis]